MMRQLCFPVCRPEKRPGPLSLMHRKLVTEDGVLTRQASACSSYAGKDPEDQKEP